MSGVGGVSAVNLGRGFGLLKRLVKILLAGVLLISLAGAIALYVYYRSLAGPCESHDALLRQVLVEPTRVFAADGTEIFALGDARRVIALEEMPPLLVEAFVRANDPHLRSAVGAPWRCLGTNVWRRLKGGREKLRCGTTIAQRLARDIQGHPEFPDREEYGISRNLQVAALAIDLANNQDADKLLYTYMNLAFLGNRAYGVEQAALNYFHKPVRELNPTQILALAVLPQRPSDYSPVSRPHANAERRHLLADRLQAMGKISAEDYAWVQNHPLTDDSVFASREGWLEQAPYFSKYIALSLPEYLGSQDIENLGVSVYTTLDLQAQRQAQKAIANIMKRMGIAPYDRPDDDGEKDDAESRAPPPATRQDLQAAIVQIDGNTGAIEALVGGRNYLESSFVRASQACRLKPKGFQFPKNHQTKEPGCIIPLELLETFVAQRTARPDFVTHAIVGSSKGGKGMVKEPWATRLGSEGPTKDSGGSPAREQIPPSPDNSPAAGPDRGRGSLGGSWRALAETPRRRGPSHVAQGVSRTVDRCPPECVWRREAQGWGIIRANYEPYAADFWDQWCLAEKGDHVAVGWLGYDTRTSKTPIPKGMACDMLRDIWAE